MTKTIAKAPAKKKAAPAQDKLAAVGVDAICGRIAECEPMRTIATDAGVSLGTLSMWLSAHPEQYARAHEARADKFADEILQIADDGANDTYQTEDGLATNHDVIARSRLRVDARKWLASKMAPKKYGDKLELSGNPKSPLVVIKDFAGKDTPLLKNKAA